MAAKRAVVMLTAGVTLLLTAACAQTISGSGTSATTTASGQLSPAPSTARATTGSGLIPYKGDRFTVSMPGRPVKSSQRVSSAAGPVKLTQLIVEKDGNAFNVAYGDYPAGAQLDLKGAASGSANGMKGQLAGAKRVTYRGTPALDFRIVNALGEPSPVSGETWSWSIACTNCSSSSSAPTSRPLRRSTYSCVTR